MRAEKAEDNGRIALIQSDIWIGLTVEVRNAEQLGGESYAYGNAAGGAPITLHRSGQTELRSGEKLSVNVPTDRIHLFDTKTGNTLRQK